MAYHCVLKIGKWTKASTIYRDKIVPAQEGTGRANINIKQLKSACENSHSF